MLNKQPKIKYTPLQVMDLEFIARAIYSFPDSNQAKERPIFLHPIKSADSEWTHGSGTTAFSFLDGIGMITSTLHLGPTSSSVRLSRSNGAKSSSI